MILSFVATAIVTTLWLSAGSVMAWVAISPLFVPVSEL